jgi:iron complex transport system substrate-binding protein
MRMAWLGGVIAVLTAALLGTPSAAADAPRRIVSLNLCIDQIVLDLVPRERIQALSWVSGDRNVSPIVDRLDGIPLLRGTAEEVLALDPDLVLAAENSTPATVDLLRRLGRRVEIIPMAFDLESVRTTIHEVARAVGEPQRGAQLIMHFNRRLWNAGRTQTGRLEAIVYQANSLVSPSGTLAASALEAAGFRNAAERLKPGAAGRISLESLVLDPPDLIALGQQAATYRTPLADNLRHPALADVLSRRAHVDLPMPLWLCGTHYSADAVAILARARSAITDRAQH